jgi:hypothetical protein
MAPITSLRAIAFGAMSLPPQGRQAPNRAKWPVLGAQTAPETGAPSEKTAPSDCVTRGAKCVFPTASLEIKYTCLRSKQVRDLPSWLLYHPHPSLTLVHTPSQIVVLGDEIL